jgi:hypothetical protein
VYVGGDQRMRRLWAKHWLMGVSLESSGLRLSHSSPPVEARSRRRPAPSPSFTLNSHASHAPESVELGTSGAPSALFGVAWGCSSDQCLHAAPTSSSSTSLSPAFVFRSVLSSAMAAATLPSRARLARMPRASLRVATSLHRGGSRSSERREAGLDIPVGVGFGLGRGRRVRA